MFHTSRRAEYDEGVDDGCDSAYGSDSNVDNLESETLAIQPATNRGPLCIVRNVLLHNILLLILALP